MEYDKLKERAKKLRIRVTKTVNGKRVKLSKKELASKLARKSPTRRPSLENQAKSAKKFIRVCKMVLKEAEPNVPRMRQPVRVSPRRVAAPMAPPPPRPMSLNPRAALMADLKADLKKRGLANN